MPSRPYYARTDPEHPGLPPDSPGCYWQPLHAHLTGVAEAAAALAARISSDSGFTRAARLAGIVHDLGKYSDAFQQMLLAASDGGARGRVEHSGHGLAIALNAKAFDVAFAVSGHHGGLSDPASLRDRAARWQPEAAEMVERAMVDMSEQAWATVMTPWEAPRDPDRLAFDLRVRMLTSCLVDADRLDAARMPHEPRALSDASARLSRLLAYVGTRTKRAQAAPVLSARAAVLDACLDAARLRHRLLSLTVPTGGGKTLASMAYALRSAALRPDDVQRIIVVIPFLSIIEQNARVYAEALGEDAIVEHHSGDFSHCDDLQEVLDEQSVRRVLATENWDAPIVVTTSVRFFESLFSNRSSDLRRVHNVAKSIVILDEVQTLPRRLLGPILSTVKGLAQDWGTTFVFCTATQPAFERPDGDGEGDARWGPGTIREIVPEPRRLFHTLRRVSVSWPKTGEPTSPRSWDEIADRLAAEPRVLCVVNLKRHARALFDRLRERTGTDKECLWHLSARMCPQHRLDALEAIRSALSDATGPCRVISTQLVEAGVDVDFPVVFRAVAPLDSIVQAAGRCDREGMLTAQRGSPAGRVVVFEPEVERGSGLPPGAYKDATNTTRLMLGTTGLSIDDPEHIRGYFNRYYQAELDVEDVNALRRSLDFPEVAARFRIIDDRTTPIVVPYGAATGIVSEVQAKGGLDMDLRRRLQRFQIGLYQRELEQAWSVGAVYELIRGSGIWCCEQRFYSNEVGMQMQSDDPLIL